MRQPGESEQQQRDREAREDREKGEYGRILTPQERRDLLPANDPVRIKIEKDLAQSNHDWWEVGGRALPNEEQAGSAHAAKEESMGEHDCFPNGPSVPIPPVK